MKNRVSTNWVGTGFCLSVSIFLTFYFYIHTIHTMQQPHLWRINHLPSAEPLAAEMLTLGLQRHLAHADLITMVTQIGDIQRAYVQLDGCDGCRHNQCRMGCRVMLLRRTLYAAGGPGLTLAPVERGLTQRPYTRMCLAWPGRQATSPVTAQLHAWPEARLLLHWKPPASALAPITATALLLVGTAGPDPASSLRQAGWVTIALPRLLAAAWMGAFPRRLPPGRPWPHAPFLLLPHAMAAASVQTQQPGTAPLEHEQVELLTAICQAIHQGYALCDDSASPASQPDTPPACRETPPDDAQPDALWPSGPGSGRNAIPPAALATLITQILSDAQITDESAPGLTRRRMAALLPDHHKEHAQTLLTWFERAGLLEPPRDPAQPWRYGRCLLIRDPDQIAAHLRVLAAQ